MAKELQLFNSLTREKEVFTPITEGYIGMYVCGPTVYSDVHLGNCRTFVGFDIIYRYLLHNGYKVRYVRNVTDVGHLEGDADSGAEDKISKKARLEQLEPMEVAQHYTNGFHEMMNLLNTKKPNIEPRATGHIYEQIEMIQQIIDNGLAYVKNGSVYFDTPKYHASQKEYGILSGRKIEDLLVETRDLKNQSEKNNPTDFAIWIKADESHLMRWDSPWSVGFPGWHLECSAMSTKYLGKRFDIHGGGGDLKFPHHENEIAQNVGACGCHPANYWLHSNMLLMNGRKMSKSDGNTITPIQLLTGESEHLSKSYSPMSIRFFMIKSHYRSTLDLTDEALAAAEKGYKRLMEGYKTLTKLTSPKGKAGSIDADLLKLVNGVPEEMNDDFNTPKALAKMFEIVTIVNSLADKKMPINEVTEERLRQTEKLFHDFIFDVFGLQDETDNSAHGTLDKVMNLVLEMRADARANKDWGTADKIREHLTNAKIVVKDGKEGTSWTLN